jgi:hypothetical protein
MTQKQPVQNAGSMRVPPGSRWQVLLMEYEILDSYWMQLHQRIWLSGLIVVGLSTVGLTFLASGLIGDAVSRVTVLNLIGTIAVILTFGWWLLIRRILAGQRVAEYRKREIERELGLRMEIYLAYLRQSRTFGTRRAGQVVRNLADGDELISVDLEKLAQSSETKPLLPGIVGEKVVWNLLPWILIAGWFAVVIMEWRQVGWL